MKPFAVFVVAFVLRWASSQPGVPMDDFGVVLATMGESETVVGK